MQMKTRTAILTGLAAIGLPALAAQAGTVQLPTSVVATSNGSGEPTGNAIDGNTSTFYGLGVNGGLLVDFVPPATGPVESIEITNGGGPDYGFEGAELWAYTGGSAATALDDFQNDFTFTGGIANPDAPNAAGELVGDWTTAASDWVFLGVVDNQSGAMQTLTVLNTASVFSHLAFFDITGQVNNGPGDGYDVARVAAHAIPAPTAALLGAAGFLGIASPRRRR